MLLSAGESSSARPFQRRLRQILYVNFKSNSSDRLRRHLVIRPLRRKREGALNQIRADGAQVAAVGEETDSAKAGERTDIPEC